MKWSNALWTECDSKGFEVFVEVVVVPFFVSFDFLNILLFVFWCYFLVNFECKFLR